MHAAKFKTAMLDTKVCSPTNVDTANNMGLSHLTSNPNMTTGDADYDLWYDQVIDISNNPGK